MSENYDFLERLIYRGMGARRFTQNSPIMPDVWIEYGLNPGGRLPVLMIPFAATKPGELAVALRGQLDEHQGVQEEKAIEQGKRDLGPRVAYNQTVVAADLYFDELIQVALPLSNWFQDTLVHGEGAQPLDDFFNDPETLKEQLLSAFSTPNYTPGGTSDLTVGLVWLARVVGTIQLATTEERSIEELIRWERTGPSDDERRELDELIVGSLFQVFSKALAPPEGKATLFGVHQNRNTIASLVDSAPAVKADATRRLFDVAGRDVTWAVIDSGIDATHVAFRERDRKDKRKDEAFEESSIPGRWRNNTRVKATYDFVAIRDRLTLGPGDSGAIDQEVLKDAANNPEADLGRALKAGRVVDWELLRPFLEIPHEKEKYRPPVYPHGTHVAGVIGADWRPEDDGDESRLEQPLRGVAPEIRLIDIRTIDDHGRADEFSLMAGMQFVRHLNSIHEERQVHGANLSFSLKHDFSVFACGSTPVCQEAERLVGTGTVIVVAAGNEGMARYELLNRSISDGYRSISITDPGNAEAVITVGATHRRDPHTYGVSYFSSRGPTGDGRPKPDLVAPGEKITSCVPGDRLAEMDGTSQAAPHVSGAIALLMERNPEMIGQPDFVKKILCDTATDLRRERYFQGAGMLDILRALQSV